MLLIKNGTVYNGRGRVFNNIDILVEGEKIKAVDYNINISDGVEIVDASDNIVLPGFIESLNIWGCIGPGWYDNDLTEHSDPITPELNVVYAFDQDGMVFQRVFEYGVTTVGITPSTANVIGGQAAVFKTYGKNPYQMLVRESAAMIASVTDSSKKVYGKRNKMPMTKMGSFALLREALTKASNYNPLSKDSKYDSKSEALKRVLNNDIPLFVNCNTKAEMNAIEIALRDFEIGLVYTGAFGVDSFTAKLVEKNSGLILGDLTNAMSMKNADVDFCSIAKLVEQGVDIAISSGGDLMSSGKESLLWNAILCHKNGIKSEDVLKMITYNPAKLLRIDDRVGSIEAGKDADFVIWSANPIETYAAQVRAAYINGDNVLNSRGSLSCW